MLNVLINLFCGTQKKVFKNTFQKVFYHLTPTIQKFGFSKIFLCLKEVSYSQQSCIYLIKKYSKYSNIMIS